MILALLAAGCGSDGEEGSPTTGSSKAHKSAGTQSPQPRADAPAPQGERSGTDTPAQQGRQGADGAGERSEPSRGGEASIEGFGSEAAGSEREAVLSAFRGYMNAVAEESPATACSYLSATVQRSLGQLVVERLKAKGCPTILPKLLAPTAAAIAREQASGEVTKVRVEGDRAFIVFKAPGAELYQLTMVREGGEWKAATVIAAVLVPSL